MLLFFCHFLTGPTHYTKTSSCHEFTCYSKRTLFKRIYAVWTKIKSSTKLFLGKNAKSKVAVHTTVFFSGKPVMIVTEYMENGSLDTFLKVGIKHI